MKPTLLYLALLTRAVALTATFDQLNPLNPVPSGYTENGIRFTSPTALSPVTSYLGATLFGWGGYTYTGNALRVLNNGWVGISAPGILMTGVSFSGGFDWDGFAIENGLLDVTFEWQTWLGGQMTATAATTWGREHPVHQFSASISTGGVFDSLRIRSTAVAYQGILAAVPSPWYYERGAVLGYGNANHIAFDNVSVQTAPMPATVASVPDSGNAAVLFLVALGVLGVRRWV